MKSLKVYVAGKVSPNSVFGTHDWRDNFCKILGEKTGLEIINLDPTKSDEDFDLDENNAELLFGRDSYMIKMSDVIIVNLTDDISVGGSQEMLIAKHFKKPLIGIAPKDGKFYKEKKTILGKEYTNWVHPFVKIPCDVLVEDIEGVAQAVKEIVSNPNYPVKDMSVVDEIVEYYERDHYDSDKMLH